jgi:hypothetical protein
MRTIIAGSRDITDYDAVCDILNVIHDTWMERGMPITEIVSGCARGVDRMGERWAKEQDIPIKRFPAEWAIYGKRAGPVRNSEMAAYAQALIAIKHKVSVGTDDMIRQAKRKGLMIVVHVI